MSERVRIAIFIAIYFAITILSFLFDRHFMSWERGDYNLPRWVYLALGPFIALDNSTGFEIYIFASLFVIPIGIWAVCAASFSQKLIRSSVGVAIWLGLNSFFF